ncbi:XRE family transcriptional regulator [bacterium D16-51]|nr:XRE family transcriptional regulator [bacterium D16-59]RKI55412.1 XRE family transcriptional regulator [bacterium D16-51]
MDKKEEVKRRRQPKELNKQIGERCRKARETAGYTQEQLADQIGVSTQFLSDAERGVTGMSVNTIVKLCGILNISADFLLLGMEEPDGAESPLSIYTRMKRLSPQERELVEEVTNLMMKSFHLPK